MNRDNLIQSLKNAQREEKQPRKGQTVDLTIYGRDNRTGEYIAGTAGNKTDAKVTTSGSVILGTKVQGTRSRFDGGRIIQGQALEEKPTFQAIVFSNGSTIETITSSSTDLDSDPTVPLNDCLCQLSPNLPVCLDRDDSINPSNPPGIPTQFNPTIPPGDGDGDNPPVNPPGSGGDGDDGDNPVNPPGEPDLCEPSVTCEWIANSCPPGYTDHGFGDFGGQILHLCCQYGETPPGCGDNGGDGGNGGDNENELNYACTENGCVRLPGGTYPTLEDCQSACQFCHRIRWQYSGQGVQSRENCCSGLGASCQGFTYTITPTRDLTNCPVSKNLMVKLVPPLYYAPLGLFVRLNASAITSVTSEVQENDGILVIDYVDQSGNSQKRRMDVYGGLGIGAGTLIQSFSFEIVTEDNTDMCPPAYLFEVFLGEGNRVHSESRSEEPQILEVS